MALDVAAAALKSRRGLEDVPQGPSARLAAGGEVVEGDDELVAFVADVGGAVAERRGLYRDLLVTLALAFRRVQDLETEQKKGGVILWQVRLGDAGEEEKNKGSLPGISSGFLWRLLGTHQFE